MENIDERDGHILGLEAELRAESKPAQEFQKQSSNHKPRPMLTLG